MVRLGMQSDTIGVWIAAFEDKMGSPASQVMNAKAHICIPYLILLCAGGCA